MRPLAAALARARELLDQPSPKVLVGQLALDDPGNGDSPIEDALFDVAVLIHDQSHNTSRTPDGP